MTLADGQRRHLERVLRLGEGSPVSYTDGRGVEGTGHLLNGAVMRGPEVTGAAPARVTLAVAPPAERSRARFIVEKLAELGVARLVWVHTRRTEGRPPPPARSEAWAEAALEQSRGSWLMEVASGRVEALDRPLVVADRSGTPSWPGGCACVLVGPEGGFDEAELPEDAVRVSFAPTVLRVETAAVVAATLALARQ
ncbi:hypothetical protein BH23ACT5_BH23ACT5_22580 [soil metagenome]